MLLPPQPAKQHNVKELKPNYKRMNEMLVPLV